MPSRTAPRRLSALVALCFLAATFATHVHVAEEEHLWPSETTAHLLHGHSHATEADAHHHRHPDAAPAASAADPEHHDHPHQAHAASDHLTLRRAGDGCTAAPAWIVALHPLVLRTSDPSGLSGTRPEAPDPPARPGSPPPPSRAPPSA